MEAKYRHLPVTPFHGELQKVKGKVDGFTEQKEKRYPLHSLLQTESQGGKLPLGIAPVFSPN
jgi:hypothetical protein